jgi:hypothetical protein
LELARLSVTDWRVDRIGSTQGCEFFAWLRRGGGEAVAALTESELNAQRLALLKRTLLDAKEQIEFLVTGQSPTTAAAELALALERANIENETLRAELDRTMLTRDSLAAASAKWFGARHD